MAVEQDDKQESIDQEKLAEDAAFEAAFAGEENDVRTPETHQDAGAANSNDHVNTDQAQPESSASDETAATGRVEVIPGFSSDELTAALALIPQLKKSIETQNGTYGQKFQSYEKTIKDLQADLKRARETPTQSASIKVTPESFKALRAAGFDELADSLAQDLGGLLPSGEQSIDIDAIKQELRHEYDGKLNQIMERQFNESLSVLNTQHPDWSDIAGFGTTEEGLIIWNNQGFGNWVAQQQPDVRKEILDSSDPRKIAGWINDYKSTLGEQQQETVDTKQANTRRQNVLSKAVNPRGATASKQMSDKQIEDEAYRRAMAGED